MREFELQSRLLSMGSSLCLEGGGEGPIGTCIIRWLHMLCTHYCICDTARHTRDAPYR